MHLEGDLDAVLGGEALHRLPVGDSDFVPLVIEHLQKFRRPGAGDPVGRAVARRAGGHAGEAIDDGHAQRLGQAHSVAQFHVSLLGHSRVGMQGVVVDAEGAEQQAAGGDGLQKLLPLPSIGQQVSDAAMLAAGVAADAYLDRRHAGGGGLVERVLEVKLLVQGGEDTDAHGLNLQITSPRGPGFELSMIR